MFVGPLHVEGLLKLRVPCTVGVKLLVLSKLCPSPRPEKPELRLKFRTFCDEGVKLLDLSKVCPVSLPETPGLRSKLLMFCTGGVKLLVRSKLCRKSRRFPSAGCRTTLASSAR